jgi:putative transcriptional regulator
MRLGFLPAATVLLILMAVASGSAAQTVKDQSVFLVARRDMSDPVFQESVILMLPSTEGDGDTGLIVNKPTRITLGEVFRKDSELKKRTDTVYLGGPVDIETVSAIFLSPQPLPKAIRVAGDLYFTFDSDLIRSILKKPKEVTAVRVFLGRSGWSPGQLDDEMDDQSWYRLHQADHWIFDRKPENLWPALINQAEPGDVVQLPRFEQYVASRVFA